MKRPTLNTFIMKESSSSHPVNIHTVYRPQSPFILNGVATLPLQYVEWEFVKKGQLRHRLGEVKGKCCDILYYYIIYILLLNIF